MTGLSLGIVALQSVGVGLSTVTATVTALAGAFVAYQGYRGYRRNDSRPMLYLAVGILLLTTVSFLVQQAVGLAAGGAATAQFAALTVSIAGLLAVLYSFTGA
ncbi:hypothetical protein SAMN05216559_0802 [Halomicrobium zhouii]|uniref:Uncharacterized protein n=1 Tax=Halomicrobium zhouii TaxID=767519 RepID=A0A1I6KH76_9EURY|nr:hypothetical protein [Halomicrobium zhouii]SFR90524.1 hypothetical protein SAMN05216559_0802 [Halomicrobium zhouii]